MNVPLRIMLTADQKRLIEAAAALEQVDMTAWVRPILLKAAEERIERGSIGQPKAEGEPAKKKPRR